MLCSEGETECQGWIVHYSLLHDLLWLFCPQKVFGRPPQASSGPSLLAKPSEMPNPRRCQTFGDVKPSEMPNLRRCQTFGDACGHRIEINYSVLRRRLCRTIEHWIPGMLTANKKVKPKIAGIYAAVLDVSLKPVFVAVRYLPLWPRKH